jgi:hypothetical protein
VIFLTSQSNVLLPEIRVPENFPVHTLILFSAFLHVKEGIITHGALVRRTCYAKMTAFYLDNPDDHRIIIIPSGYHRHPPFRPVKLSIPARVEYEE